MAGDLKGYRNAYGNGGKLPPGIEDKANAMIKGKWTDGAQYYQLLLPTLKSLLSQQSTVTAPQQPAMEGDDASLFDDATCNMSEAGEACPVHGVEECYGADTSPLAGQYGHSGKMKPVSKDLSFLDRLKELSGLNK
jgi:hypothetical protein